MHRKADLDSTAFNPKVKLPYQLRVKDFELAMQDVYDFFHDVNELLLDRGLHRLDDMLRPAAMSGMISDMLTASMSSKEFDRIMGQALQVKPKDGKPKKAVKAKTTKKKRAAR